MGEGVYQLLFHILSFGYISQQHQELTKLSVLLLPPPSPPLRATAPPPPVQAPPRALILRTATCPSTTKG